MNLRSLRSRSALVGLAVCALMLVPPFMAQGAITSPPTEPLLLAPLFQTSAATLYSGLDILFIVDQSGSMGGTAWSNTVWAGAPNDPNGIRFAAPPYVMQWLGLYRQSLGVADKPRIRVALLTFGDAPRMLRNWTWMSDKGDPTGTVPGEAEWDAEYEQIATEVSADRFGHTNLGNTDFIEALEYGRQMFEKADPLPSGQNHLRAVIILTDGKPCAPERADCGYTNTEQDHLAQLAQLAQTNFPAPNYVFYVVAMDDLAAWQTVEAGWQSVVSSGGRPTSPLSAVRVDNMTGMAMTFQDILNELLNNVQPTLVYHCVLAMPGGCEIPPYQQVLQVSAFKPDSNPLGANLVLMDPLGAAPSIAKVDGENMPIEVRVIKDPVPGVWNADIADAALKPQIQLVANTIGASVVMDPPADLNPLRYNTVPLTIRVLQSNKIDTLTGYDPAISPLKVTVDLRTPPKVAYSRQTSVATLDLTHDPAAGDLHQYTAAWLPADATEVEAWMTVSYDFKGTTYYLLQNEKQNFVIAPRDVYPQHYGLSEPSILEGGTTKVRVDVLEKDTDAPVDAKDYKVQVTVTPINDPTLAETFDLVNTSTTPGVIEGEIIPKAGPGEYLVTVNTMAAPPGGVPVAIEPLGPQTYNLTVRPFIQVSMLFTLPENGSDVEAEEFGPLPKPFSNAEVEVRVEVRDNNNNLVPLSAVTGGVQSVPSLLVTNKDGDEVDLGVPLRPVAGQDGVYTLKTDKLGRGEYTFTASVPATIKPSGDYSWASTKSTVVQKRHLAPFILWGGAALLFGTMALIGSIWFLGYRVHKGRVGPLTGTLVLLQREHTPQGPQDFVLASFDLGGHNRNRVKLGARQMPQPFRRMVVTTHGDPSYTERGAVIVEQLTVADQQEYPPFVLEAGMERGVWADPYGVEYVVAKDVGYGADPWAGLF